MSIGCVDDAQANASEYVRNALTEQVRIASLPLARPKSQHPRASQAENAPRTAPILDFAIYAMNPRFAVANRETLGNTAFTSPGPTPNHAAIVAAY